MLIPIIYARGQVSHLVTDGLGHHLALDLSRERSVLYTYSYQQGNINVVRMISSFWPQATPRRSQRLSRATWLWQG